MLETPRLLAALALAALLAACSSTPMSETGAPVETRTPTPVAKSANEGAATSGTAQSQVTSVDASRNAANAASAEPAQRIVYFDFDSFVIKDEYKPVVETWARWLSANAAKKAVVEGNTDERGSSEYNLALGQKRAEAVVKSLELLGARASQLEAVSFGKERPAVEGHDEAAWAKNRRAELKVR
ncbi:MAG: peptidoglycan-associated lipoprotein Pal [Burkholderiales bacterium]|nr:peptidoglycan-associated lipoprotein Pal [Burkholderiales bacterium]